MSVVLVNYETRESFVQAKVSWWGRCIHVHAYKLGESKKAVEFEISYIVALKQFTKP